MTGFLIALLSGALMSVQGVFNTQVTKDNRIVGQQYLGAVKCFSGMSGGMVSGRKSGCDGTCEGGTEIYALRSVIGAGITWTVVKSMASLGPAKAALLIVISQLIVRM